MQQPSPPYRKSKTFYLYIAYAFITPGPPIAMLLKYEKFGFFCGYKTSSFTQ
jgi:hypothetical protein